jgi:hypothetical protein
VFFVKISKKTRVQNWTILSRWLAKQRLQKACKLNIKIFIAFNNVIVCELYIFANDYDVSEVIETENLLYK